MAMTPPPIGLFSILSESKRIINAHSRHFLALSVLFLLPLSFSLTVYPSISRLLTQSAAHDSVSLLRSASVFGGGDQPVEPPTEKMVVFAFVFTVFLSIVSLMANGSITYSVLQGFYGRPVKLFSAVKAGLFSFFPLLVTLISAEIFIIGILLALGFSMFGLIRGIEIAGFEIEYSSPYFIAISIVLTLIAVIILTNLKVNWNLAWVIAVVESTWGIQPLKRSKTLVKGMRSVSLSLILFFASTTSVLVWISAAVAAARLNNDVDDNGEGWWTYLAFILQIVVTTAGLTVLMLYQIAANTVFYMYCKAVNGELVWEIAEEFAREYVRLPFDDGKVPHLVSVAYNV